MKLWPWLLVPMVAGCGFTVADHGSDINITGISLVYTDWVAPAESNWEKDSFECDRDAREALPSLFLPLEVARRSLSDASLPGGTSGDDMRSA